MDSESLATLWWMGAGGPPTSEERLSSKISTLCRAWPAAASCRFRSPTSLMPRRMRCLPTGSRNLAWKHWQATRMPMASLSEIGMASPIMLPAASELVSLSEHEDALMVSSKRCTSSGRRRSWKLLPSNSAWWWPFRSNNEANRGAGAVTLNSESICTTQSQRLSSIPRTALRTDSEPAHRTSAETSSEARLPKAKTQSKATTQIINSERKKAELELVCCMKSSNKGSSCGKVISSADWPCDAEQRRPAVRICCAEASKAATCSRSHNRMQLEYRFMLSEPVDA
mmetsp:Transcript_156846/g.503427  ORF Transcript_156846/g.503427 Transcript_156846/m.503427 type:complete len:284 (-) Transcript_156846:1189-2040(-)